MARMVVPLAAFLLLAAACTSESDGTSGTGTATKHVAASTLGTPNPAKGTPVKVGLVSNGKTASLDTSVEDPVANAAVKWVNEYKAGIGGHPIELEVCLDQNDPSKAADCANQMIQDNVVAVLIGSNGLLANVWAPLQKAGVPVFIYGAPNPNVTAEPKSTFVLGDSGGVLFGLSAGVAKSEKAKKVTAVVIDVPAATSFYKESAPALFKAEDLDFKLVAVAAGTADMTPQMQRVTSENPDGVVFVIGNDAFCIAAFNGLRTAGFKGTVTAYEGCITDATIKAVPADFLEGIRIGASAPTNDQKDPSIQEFNAVMAKYGPKGLDLGRPAAIPMYNTVGAFDEATAGLKGAVTSKSIIAAAKSMKRSVIPGTGGRHFQCNGKANPDLPAVCTVSLLAATIGSDGKATGYKIINDEPIGG